MIGISTHSASSANVDSLYTTMLNSLTSHKSRGGLFVEGRPLWPILDSLAATYQFAGVAELHVPTAVARSARVDLVNAGITSLELVPGEGAVYRLTEPKVAETLCAVLVAMGVPSVSLRMLQLLPQIGLARTGVKVCVCVWLCVCVCVCVCVAVCACACVCL